MGVSAQVKVMIDRAQCLWVAKYRLKSPTAKREKEAFNVGAKLVAEILAKLEESRACW